MHFLLKVEDVCTKETFISRDRRGQFLVNTTVFAKMAQPDATAVPKCTYNTDHEPVLNDNSIIYKYL